MGMVVDLVPNHMGVLHADNAWWLDVLEKGRASPYAKFFDIDWARGKLLLPVLGKHYGEALEELKLERDRKSGKWSVRYFDHRFPLNAKSQVGLKAAPKDTLALHRLLEKQYYRLAYWRVASDEINYRRFFEITDLAGLRMEDRTVFEATHGLVSRLVEGGGIDGVRIDHPDGLADPKQYFDRLSERFPRRWIVLEKILADDEKLPEDWPVHGETGYRFVNLLTGLFMDGAAESRFDRIYQRFTGERRTFEELARESRMLIMATTLAAELFMLSNWLARIAAGNRYTRDYTASGLRKALAEIAAQFPVYRTYVSARGVSDTDRRVIDAAVKGAKRATRIADPSVLDFVRSVLTLDAAPESGERRREMLNFSMRFQQFTAPVVAKGVEDTAFYRYNRLIALNEVGGHPSHFGFALQAFHAAATSARGAGLTPCWAARPTTPSAPRTCARASRCFPSWPRAGAWRCGAGAASTAACAGKISAGRRIPLLPGADRRLAGRSVRRAWSSGSRPTCSRRRARPSSTPAGSTPTRNTKRRSSASSPSRWSTRSSSTTWPIPWRASRTSACWWDFRRRSSRSPRPACRITTRGPSCGISAWSIPTTDGPWTTSYARSCSTTIPILLNNLADGRAKMHVIRKGLEVRKKHPGLFHGAKYTPLYADQRPRAEHRRLLALRRRAYGGRGGAAPLHPSLGRGRPSAARRQGLGRGDARVGRLVCERAYGRAACRSRRARRRPARHLSGRAAGFRDR